MLGFLYDFLKGEDPKITKIRERSKILKNIGDELVEPATGISSTNFNEICKLVNPIYETTSRQAENECKAIANKLLFCFKNGDVVVSTGNEGRSIYERRPQ